VQLQRPSLFTYSKVWVVANASSPLQLQLPACSGCSKLYHHGRKTCRFCEQSMFCPI